MILVCAATQTEAAACRRGIDDAIVPGFEVLTTGVGPDRATRALEAWLTARRDRGVEPGDARWPSLIVSSGFAGALTTEIAPLAWVTATALYTWETEDTGGALGAARIAPVSLAPDLLRAAHDALACSFLTADKARSLPVEGVPAPTVVDMESAALARTAAAAHIPFLALRLITDTPAQPLARLGHALAELLATEGPARRATCAIQVALRALRTPRATCAFVRDALGWRRQLRRGWRHHAQQGLP